MNEFQRVKEDHFQNLPFTRKQITDLYNSLNGTTKDEKSLFFVQTIGLFLDYDLPSPFFTLQTNEIAFCHYVLGSHNSRFTIGLSALTPIDIPMRGSDEISDQLKNFFFTALLPQQGQTFFCFSVFKFA